MASELKPFGYAPGSYMNNCKSCSQSFMGDKRAWNCEPCAKALSLQKAGPVSPVSPDATGKCGELVTVKPLYGPKTNICWTQDNTPKEHRKIVQLMPEGDYVTRSQAEELLAAKDADIAYWVKETQRCLKSAQSLADDNAALTARIKELEDILRDHRTSINGAISS